MRWTALGAALVCILALTLPGGDAQAKGNRDRILAGPGIQHELWIPEYIDGEIHRVPDPVEVTEEPVTIWSEAWLPLIEWPSDQPSVPFEVLVGRYYAEHGLLAVDAASGERWFALDEERRQRFDRYIRLARTGEVERRPSLIGAHLAAWQLLDEPIPLDVAVAGRQLGPAETETFWALLLGSEEGELRPSDFDAGATNFGGWAAHVWPIDPNRDVRIMLCGDQPPCQEWHLLRNEAFLAHTVRGWPSWPGFDVSTEMQAFVDSFAEARAEPASPGAAAASDRPGSPPGVPSSGASTAPRPARELTAMLGLGLLVAGGARLLIRRRRQRTG